MSSVKDKGHNELIVCGVSESNEARNEINQANNELDNKLMVRTKMRGMIRIDHSKAYCDYMYSMCICIS